MIATENLKGVSGVYAAVHRDTLRLYIGSSVNIGERRLAHIKDARRGKRQCFHRAIREFGADAFDFELIEWCPRNVLREREEFWIRFYNSASINGFNTYAKTAFLPDGFTISDATRARISAQVKGRKLPPFTAEHRLNLSIALKGRIISAETRAKMGLANKGRIHTDQARENMSAAQKGRKITDATRVKISASLTGHKLSPETIAKRTASRAGYRHSEETKAKMSLSQKGRVHDFMPKWTPERFAKIKATWALKRKAEGGLCA